MQVSQEADQVVWYFHLLQNFPQFIVIHTVKGFGFVCMCILEEAWQPTPVFLPGESPWTEKPEEQQSLGSKRVRHD